MVLGFFNFRCARGGAVQRTAAAPGGAELAAFPKHFHLALRVLQDKINSVQHKVRYCTYLRAGYVHTLKFEMSVRKVLRPLPLQNTFQILSGILELNFNRSGILTLNADPPM